MNRPARLAAVLLSLVLAAAALAACGDDGDGEATTVTETETVETTTQSETSTTADGEAPPADKEVEELTGFTSPSGNIGCYIDRSSVRCDIADRDWEPPKPPKSCKLDYGQGITMSAGAAPELVCAGDSALESGEPLPYGRSIAAGLLRCESEESGITCRDIETGRGFTISKQRYELF